MEDHLRLWTEKKHSQNSSKVLTRLLIKKTSNLNLNFLGSKMVPKLWFLEKNLSINQKKS